MDYDYSLVLNQITNDIEYFTCLAKVDGKEDIIKAHLSRFFVCRNGVPEALVIKERGWHIHYETWKMAVENALQYLGSINLISFTVQFSEQCGLAPGHDPEKVYGSLIVEAEEAGKRRVARWELKANRVFAGAKDDMLYMTGTNNRPFGYELAREISRLF